MPAYVIGEAHVFNPAAMTGYGAKVMASVKKYGGRYLARGSRPEVLEGGPAHNILIIEFEIARHRATLVRVAGISGGKGVAAGQFESATVVSRFVRQRGRLKTMKRATINALRAAFLLAIVAGAQAAENYPSRPIRLIVAFAPGGVADVMGRLVAQALQQRLNQSVVVENKPGGDGLIGMGDAVHAAPDGYTLLVGGFGGQIIPPLMRDDFPFDVRRDLVKIALTAEFGNVLVVNKSLPVNSVPDLIAYLKARPGAVNFGSSGRATSDLLAAAMFMLQTGTKMIDVPYAGGGQALSDMMAGTTQVMFPQLPAVLGLIDQGRFARSRSPAPAGCRSFRTCRR